MQSYFFSYHFFYCILGYQKKVTGGGGLMVRESSAAGSSGRAGAGGSVVVGMGGGCDDDGVVVVAAMKPAWLQGLMAETFFAACGVHENRRKNEKNIFCLDCCQSFCPHCLPSHHSHPLLQVGVLSFL